MKSQNSQIKAWAADASTKLKKIAEGTPPDARVKVRTKVIALRPHILALRPDYSWDAIAKMLDDPEINLKVKPSTLRRLVSASRKHRAA